MEKPTMQDLRAAITAVIKDGQDNMDISLENAQYQHNPECIYTRVNVRDLWILKKEFEIYFNE